jgi:hypothetical protein
MAKSLGKIKCTQKVEDENGTNAHFQFLNDANELGVHFTINQLNAESSKTIKPGQVFELILEPVKQ